MLVKEQKGDLIKYYSDSNNYIMQLQTDELFISVVENIKTSKYTYVETGVQIKNTEIDKPVKKVKENPDKTVELCQYFLDLDYRTCCLTLGLKNKSKEVD